MRNQKTQNANENKMYFCSLCPYMATFEELDVHYALEHDDIDDLSYEIETMLENKKASKKKKDLKGKVIEQLMLMIEGVRYKNEYVGWCETRYEVYSKKIGNKYIIELVPGVSVC